jgi:hypothetical protein
VASTRRPLSGASAPRLGSTDCERPRDGALAQPVNALSSLALIVAAASIARRAVAPAPNAEWVKSGAQRAVSPTRRREQAALAASVAAAGVGSYLFHGPQPRGARAVHDLSIALVLGLAAGAGRRAKPSWSSPPAKRAVGLLGAAIVTLVLGRTGSPLCRPDARLQLHGLWHVLCALTLDAYSVILARGRPSTGIRRPPRDPAP